MPTKCPHIKSSKSRQFLCQLFALLREANALVPQVLDEATKARAKSIQLQGLEFASELSGELKKHGASMESYYSDLKTALGSKNPDERAIKKLIQKINHKMAWFSKAEAGFVQKFSHGCSNEQLYLSNPALVADTSTLATLIRITSGICHCHDEEAR